MVLECETYSNCSLPLAVSLVPIEHAMGIQIILEWEDLNQDLDLHVLAVNSLDPRVSCETSASNMDGCKDISLNHNKREGGDSEVVSISNVAANSRFTYMVFADDSSINGPLLGFTDGITVTVTDGVVANIEDVSVEAIEVGTKYWFVGCVKLVGDTFVFEPVDQYSREDPATANRLHCDNLFKRTIATPTTEPFCQNVDAVIKVRNSLTNQLVPNATVSLIKVSEEEEVIITEGLELDEDGKAFTLINENGQYSIKVEADGFISDERDLNVECSIEDCSSCSPSVFIPLSPTLEPGTMRLSLSWGPRPLDLDLQVVRRSFTDWSDECGTSYSQKTGCRLAVLDLDNTRGGNNGGETITLNSLDEQQDNIYMVFVDNFIGSKVDEFKSSEAHISMTDGVVSHNIDLQASEYKDEKYWLAGCIRFVDGSYEFMPLNAFFNDKPSEEVPDMCLENFGFSPPTTKSPWYKIWG